MSTSHLRTRLESGNAEQLSRTAGIHSMKAGLAPGILLAVPLFVAALLRVFW